MPNHRKTFKLKAQSAKVVVATTQSEVDGKQITRLRPVHIYAAKSNEIKNSTPITFVNSTAVYLSTKSGNSCVLEPLVRSTVSDSLRAELRLLSDVHILPSEQKEELKNVNDAEKRTVSSESLSWAEKKNSTENPSSATRSVSPSGCNSYSYLEASNEKQSEKNVSCPHENTGNVQTQGGETETQNQDQNGTKMIETSPHAVVETSDGNNKDSNTANKNQPKRKKRKQEKFVESENLVQMGTIDSTSDDTEKHSFVSHGSAQTQNVCSRKRGRKPKVMDGVTVLTEEEAEAETRKKLEELKRKRLEEMNRNKCNKKKRVSKREKSASPTMPDSTVSDLLDAELPPDAAYISSPTVTVAFPNIEIARNIGVRPGDLTEDLIRSRKVSVERKMRCGGMILEEYDIHSRAELYVASIIPDPQYINCDISLEELEFHKAMETEAVEDLKWPIATINALPSNPPLRRRKKTYMEEFVVYKGCKNSNLADTSRVLPEESRLFKPKNKLVQLVAQSISDSPDGMLQVQQVYMALQNKYPYFRYMEKSFLTSWRSSVRHALYQKWFRKITFGVSTINSKGCYWAINRLYTPKEWNLPLPSYASETECPSEEFSLITNPSLAQYLAEQRNLSLLQYNRSSATPLGSNTQENQNTHRSATSSKAQTDAFPVDLRMCSPQVHRVQIPQPPAMDADPTLAMVGAGTTSNEGRIRSIQLSPVVPVVRSADNSQELTPDDTDPCLRIETVMSLASEKNTNPQPPDNDYSMGTSWEEYSHTHINLGDMEEYHFLSQNQTMNSSHDDHEVALITANQVHEIVPLPEKNLK